MGGTAVRVIPAPALPQVSDDHADLDVLRVRPRASMPSSADRNLNALKHKYDYSCFLVRLG